MSPWDNPTVDALLWVLTISAVCWWLLRRQARRVEQDPLAEPLSHVRHVNVDDVGRVLKIGVDCHARACVDDEGRVLCVCGMDAA